MFANTGDMGSISGSERSPGEGNGLPEKSYEQKSLVDYSPWGHRIRHDRVTHKHAVLSV